MGLHEFFTWHEAVLQANTYAERFSTVGKPKVFWSADRWVVSFDYRPVLTNGVA